MNVIHDHKQEIRSNNEMLANLHESGRNEEGKVTRSHKETWAAPRKKETSASPVILTLRPSLFTKRTIPTNEKKGDNYSHSFTIWRGFGSVSFQIGHYDALTFLTKMNDNVMVRDIGTPLNQY